ncbi:MAG TPA: nitroreductase family deazaflavin-dependent oxidoreductase [Ktedonobacteraceae bacterium]|nr:nitroreductase family deazaflavin-dependent oxidoreductase [Ktedonobacteraceae bacterium]
MSAQKQVNPSPRSSGVGIALQRFFMRVHIFFYRLTDGVIGGNLAGHPMLLLTTIGRKSGRERITPIFYFADGDRFVLIGSNGGAAEHPQWWRNLQMHPQAHIQVGRKHIAVTASLATGAERQRVWSLVTSRYHEFVAYQKRTIREIPVVVFTIDKEEEER